MSKPTDDPSEIERIDAALKQWRQGDIAFEEQWFVHVGDPSVALTDAAAQASEAGLQALYSQVAGLAVITQTCDIVRTCPTRPYIEVAPLIQVDEEGLLTVQRGRRPSLATLPALLSNRLAVDLDRVMTVEKSIVARWKRTPGYTSDADGRAFALALARKRARFAFPDDFTHLTKKLQERFIGKHERNSEEGVSLRALREIRVQATPAWDADAVTLHFWFVRQDRARSEQRDWTSMLTAWLKLVPSSGRFVDVEGQIVTLADLTGADYVESDPLDLDHLSSLGPGEAQ